MAWRAGNISLLTGLVVSVLVHLVVITPVLTMAMTRAPRGRLLAARFEPEVFRSTAEEEKPQEKEPDLQLGIDESITSTLTWIGHEEYEEHLAKLAEFEQAPFIQEPAGGPAVPAQAPAPTSPSSESAQEPDPEEAVEEQPAEVVEAESPDPVADSQPVPEAAETHDEPTSTEPADKLILPNDATEDEQPETSPAEPAPELPIDGELMPLTGPDESAGLTEEIKETEPVPAAPVETEEPAPEQAAEQELPWPLALLELARSMRPESPPPNASPKPVDLPSEPATQPAPQPQPSDPAPPQPPSPAGVGQGEQADKESDATSTVKVPLDQIKAGKPLAAKGLEIKTHKPEFTHLIQLTASPGNPLVEIRFASDGVPREARIVETSGDSRVDAFLRSSLYEWEAAGKPLAELTGETTIDVRIRIVLNPRAPS